MGLCQGEAFGLKVETLDFLRARTVEVKQQMITLLRQPPYLVRRASDHRAVGHLDR